jgi:hypothetical protein
MFRRQFVLALSSALGTATLFTANSQAQTDAPRPQRKPDLGDAAEGVYFGDVISDSKGSGKSGVTLTVTRIARNQIQVTSDYPRLPVVDVVLTRAMGKILQARGDSVFLLDPAKAHLDVSFLNEVSWSGSRR